MIEQKSPTEEDGRLPLPQHTTPTWEMELLISGATVFSLLQMPDLLDSVFYSVYPRFDAASAAVALLPYTYVIAATYALIGTFVLHLGARAYWVALVGLRSVYPDGVDWDKLKRWGPNYQRLISAQYPSLAFTVERADNRASRVFGFGIGFAMMLLGPLFIMLLLSSSAYVIFEISGRALPWTAMWSIVFAVFFLPFVTVLLLDRFAGNRLGDAGRFGRLAQGMFRTYFRIGMGNFNNYPILLFFSRMGQVRGSVFSSVAVLVVLGFVLVRMVSREDLLPFDGYSDLPSMMDTNGRTLDPRHYADERMGRLAMVTQPFIQSEIIEDDYVRLFLPYQPQRDADVLHELCGDVLAPAAMPEERNAALAATRAASATLLDCAASLYTVTIDAQPVPPLRFDLAEEPQLQLRGFVAMIDVANLPRGRHELRIVRARSSQTDEASQRNAQRRSSQPRTIPFWR